MSAVTYSSVKMWTLHNPVDTARIWNTWKDIRKSLCVQDGGCVEDITVFPSSAVPHKPHTDFALIVLHH